MKSVPDMLREAAQTYEERNKVYGDNYKQFGHAMAAMFPKGLTVVTPEDWNRLGIFVQSASKMTRYANSFAAGGHDDSMLDLSVYSQMQREVDFLSRYKKDAFHGHPGKGEK